LADELAAVFARLSGLLVTQETVQTSLQLVAALADETIPDSAGAGVTLVDESGARKSAAATAPRVVEADQIQYDLDQGPCLTAWRDGVVVRVGDTATDSRFPLWARAAHDLGLRSSLSAPLVAGHQTLGAIKVYSTQSGAFADQSQRLLPMFASQAAVLLANVQAYESARQVTDQLREALKSRDVISTAKGIIMVRDRVTDEDAFRILVSLASRENRKLRDVAQDMVTAVQRRRNR
jgi:GAF domain-containing protein